MTVLAPGSHSHDDHHPRIFTTRKNSKTLPLAKGDDCCLALLEVGCRVLLLVWFTNEARVLIVGEDIYLRWLSSVFSDSVVLSTSGVG